MPISYVCVIRSRIACLKRTFGSFSAAFERATRNGRKQVRIREQTRFPRSRSEMQAIDID